MIISNIKISQLWTNILKCLMPCLDEHRTIYRNTTSTYMSIILETKTIFSIKCIDLTLQKYCHITVELSFLIIGQKT